jgi:Sulfotransferase domain
VTIEYSTSGGTIRIAMWSGPRNLSTALMRSFGNRGDCFVSDEPFYAAYLTLTGLEHPMRDDILSHHETDWTKVADAVGGAAPDGAPLWYQKHMTHHMLPEIGRDWMRACRHAFLIRHPARVLASYAAKREDVTLDDIGFPQQEALFNEAAATAGAPPPVVDADALLDNPRRVLTHLCEALGIAFSERMLSWPAGPRDTDGIWAPHWYDAVNRSTGFSAAKSAPLLDDPHLKRIEKQALPIYERLSQFALS